MKVFFNLWLRMKSFSSVSNVSSFRLRLTEVA